MMVNERKHLLITGKVQGVGFRAYTQYVAVQHGMVGWVRNVGYDQVELVAEGSEDDMQRFIVDVKKRSEKFEGGKGRDH